MKLPPRRWLSLTIGLALCGAVIVIGFHFSEAEDFVRFAKEARPTLLLLAAAWQVATYGAQAEIWRLLSGHKVIESLGERAQIAGVFVTFMIASLVRSMGLVPGGVGTFEAGSVITLRMTGARLSVALAATLMFRALTFWLPMLPGLWYSRRLVRTHKAGSSVARG